MVLGVADARTIPLADESVQCCITSPPYWGLRDYGTGEWEGGDAECEHKVRQDPRVESSTLGGGKATVGHQQEGYRRDCPRCGARRIDRQIGLEASPDEYVAQIVGVFREVRRVLRKDGTVWLNLGDSYAGSQKGMGANGVSYAGPKQSTNVGSVGLHVQDCGSLKPKDMVGIPWRVAFALQADGWWLRSDIIWHKPSVMPESVTDRPTKEHEYVFLLARSRRYYYDAEAVREGYAPSTLVDVAGGYGWGAQSKSHDAINAGMRGSGGLNDPSKTRAEFAGHGGRNKRSVWTITTQPYKGAHFATFPVKLVEPMVLAGTSAKGCCPECGKPWERVMERGEFIPMRWAPGDDKTQQAQREVRGATEPSQTSAMVRGGVNQKVTIGWLPGCDCGTEHLISQDELDADPTLLDDEIEPFEPVPCTVLDPFGGTMTVGEVCAKHGRRFVGLDLKPEYVEMGRERCATVQTAYAL